MNRETFEHQLNMALDRNDTEQAATLIADYVAEQIAAATTPAAIVGATRNMIGLRVEGFPPAEISEEPAPDAVPVEDEHRELLDVILSLTTACRQLLQDRNPISYAVTIDIDGMRALITRANAILAEHYALNIAPEPPHED